MASDAQDGPADLPRTVFLDANFIVSVLFDGSLDHKPARELFTRLVAGVWGRAVRLFVTPLVVSEAWWALGRLFYEERHGPGSWKALARRRPGRRQALRTYASEIVAKTELLVRAGIVSVAEVGVGDVPVAVRHTVGQEVPHLDPRDAFHLAVMKRLGIEAIVTNDPDFAEAPDIIAIPYSP